MKQIQIQLPDALKAEAEKYAQAMGITLDRLIADLLTAGLKQKNNAESDPIFTEQSVFTGKVPADSSTNHDNYLYDN